MYRIAELATRYRVPLNIHAEAEPKVVAAMERLLKQFPETPVIWAHNCGRQAAAGIRRLLGTYPNLFCDLGDMANTGPGSGCGSGWPRRMPWTFLVNDLGGQLFPEMKELFEAFPDRFMIGIDVYSYAAYRFYPTRVSRFRELLSQLSPATARKLAFENAERVLKLPPLLK